MAAVQKVMETAVTDLAALLDAGDDAVVTLVAGEMRLVAHRAVLVDRSPVFSVMFAHDTLEASSGEVAIADVEGPVLRQLVSCLYTLRAPQLSDIAAQLLTAADKYGVSGLKAACEQQVAAQLSVETAAAAAVLAVRHSCESLRKAAVAFVKDNVDRVLGTQGWADAMLSQPRDLVEVSRLVSLEPSAEIRVVTMAAVQKVTETTATDLAALLDAGDGTMVTLVAGETRMVAHRAVLMDRSPVLAAMFAHDTLEARSREVAITDVEGPVLRELLAYLYTLQAPQLPHMAAQLLAAADKYGVSGLKAACEQQVAAQLTVENAAAAAVMAVKHSLESLTKDAINFIKDHGYQVMATQGWADAMLSQPTDFLAVNRLLAEPPPDIRRLPAEEKNRRLIQAATEGDTRVMEALLAAGADVAARDEHGPTHSEDEDTDSEDEDAYTLRQSALHYAAAGGHVEAVRRLIAHGAPVDARGTMKETPLHVAAEGGHAAVVRLLLAASADHSARNILWCTPLHEAANGGRAEAAKALLQAGADRGATNCFGLTPLDLARQKNHQCLVDLLSGS